MFALIVGVYLICILPAFAMTSMCHVTGINRVANMNIFPTLLTSVIFLVISNSCMIFVIYSVKDTIFRESLLGMMHSQNRLIVYMYLHLEMSSYIHIVTVLQFP